MRFVWTRIDSRLGGYETSELGLGQLGRMITSLRISRLGRVRRSIMLNVYSFFIVALDGSRLVDDSTLYLRPFCFLHDLS